jgi:hypothetical protein
MDVPQDLDAFLAELLNSSAEKKLGRRLDLDADDRAFVERILESVTTGSKAVFVVLHPNDRLQYMLLNANRVNAVALLSEVILRTAQALRSDLDS